MSYSSVGCLPGTCTVKLGVVTRICFLSRGGGCSCSGPLARYDSFKALLIISPEIVSSGLSPLKVAQSMECVRLITKTYLKRYDNDELHLLVFLVNGMSMQVLHMLKLLLDSNLMRGGTVVSLHRIFPSFDMYVQG